MTVWQDGPVAGPVTEESLARYGALVPPAIAALWRDRGRVGTPDGFVRLLDPAPLARLAATLWPDLPGAIPLFSTAWGDVIVQYENGLVLSMPRLGLGTGLLADAAAGGGTVILQLLIDPTVQVAVLQRGSYDRAVARYGRPEHDEVFGYTVPATLGGTAELDNLTRQPLVPHLFFLQQTGARPRPLAEAEQETAVETASRGELPEDPWGAPSAP